jgi:serralysin
VSGTDTLQGVERIHFSDQFAVATDIAGHAGQAYRLYQAAFDRAPDLPGLGYQLNDLDNGNSLSWVAGNFIASPEFASRYGTDLDDTQFLDLLYQNVLHRAPDAGGLQFHLDEFAQGQTRADMLTHFSESPENQANVIGQIDNGILFVAV